MPKFRLFTGDENGLVKTVHFSVPDKKKLRMTDPINAEITKIHEKGDADKVNRMAVGRGPGGDRLLAISRASGSTSLHTYVDTSDDLFPEQDWNEDRFKTGDAFVGLSLSTKGTYTCTNSGYLRLHPFQTDDQAVGEVPSTLSLTSILPTRLKDWKLSPSGTHFAYGGDEVDLSIWDVERAFSEPVVNHEETTTSSKKRKSRKDRTKLLHGEVWRAKNLPHDNLNLRVPIQITSLAFVHHGSPDVADSHNRIITGNLSGAVRLYDIRAQERPVHNWEGVCPKAGVKHVQCGFQEHQAIVSDAQSSMYALDLRTGKPIYQYTGIRGAVVSSVPLPHQYLASISLDRFIRLHTCPPPPPLPNQNQAARGTILHQEFLKGTPSVVLWDGISGASDFTQERRLAHEAKQAEEDAEDEAIWENMPVVGSEKLGIDNIDANSDEGAPEPKKRKQA